MKNIPRKRGYTLIMVLLLMITAAIVSVGVYSYSGYIVREVRIDKRAAARGYYYAVAGARYAQILLKDPTNVTKFGFDGTGHAGFDGEVKTITVSGNAAGTLGADLNFSGNDTLTIKATEYNASNPSSTPWAVNSYQVETTFTR